MKLAIDTKDAINQIFENGFYEYDLTGDIDFRVGTILNSYVGLVGMLTTVNVITFATLAHCHNNPQFEELTMLGVNAIDALLQAKGRA